MVRPAARGHQVRHNTRAIDDIPQNGKGNQTLNNTAPKGSHTVLKFPFNICRYVMLGSGQPACARCSGPEHTCATCGLAITAEQGRVSVRGDSFHRTAACYRCGGCGRALAGRRVSRAGPGQLVCGARCRDRNTFVNEISRMLSHCSEMAPNTKNLSRHYCAGCVYKH